MSPEERLRSAGMVLPPQPRTSANYVASRRAGQLLFLAGHGPVDAGGHYVCGRLSSESDVGRGYDAAKLACLNLLASTKAAVGGLENVVAILKVLGMVNAAPDFRHHPRVIDGCSDVLITAFGDAGRHARSAVGMSSLPHGMMVEVEAVLLVAG